MQLIYILVTRPFGIVLMALYNLIGSYGLSIILFTLAVRLILMPFQIKSRKSTMAMTVLTPKVNEIQRKYKGDRVRINEEIQKLYSENNVSPTSGCVPLLIQLPILWGLYGVIQKPLTFMMGLNTNELTKIASTLGLEYSKSNSKIELTMAGMLADHFEKLQTLSADITNKLVDIDFHFLCFNLTQTPSIKDPSILWIIPILSGITALMSSLLTQKFQKKTMPQQQQQAFNQMKYMMVMMPLMSIYFGFILPACLGVYWITGNILIMLQELFISKVLKIQTPMAEIEGSQEKKPQLDHIQPYEKKNIPNKSKKRHKKEEGKK